MFEKPEHVKQGVDWNTVYSEKTLPYVPWNSDKPDPELIQLVENSRIRPYGALDVGCGTGTDAIYLASQGINVTAIDISPEAIEIARGKAGKAGVNVDFISGDFLKVEFNKTFDFVNDSGCFHIMSPLRRDEFAARVNEVLQDQGLYYLRCWSDKQEFESERTPYRISRDIILRTFSEYLDILEIKDIRWGGKGPWSYSCLMRKRVYELP